MPRPESALTFPEHSKKSQQSLHLLDLRLISVIMWELYDETLLSWWVWFYPEWLRPQLQDILIYFMVCWEWKSSTLAFTHHNTYERRSLRRYPSLGYSYIIYYRYLRFTFFSLWSTLFCRLCYQQTTLFNLLSVFSYFVQGEEELVWKGHGVWMCPSALAFLIWKDSAMCGTSFWFFISMCHSVQSRGLVVFYTRWKRTVGWFVSWKGLFSIIS